MDANTEFYKDLKTNFVDTIKDSATSDDVIKFIVKSVNEHSKTPFAHLVVKTLSYGNPTRDEFIKRVFDYVCHAVDYLRDPYGKEIIFTPKLLVSRGKGDCKKQSLFIATILKAAGIEPTLKVISYGGKDWEHIFVTVKGSNGDTITLDPVNDKKYNEEINHSHSREYYLNGTKSTIMANKLESMGAMDDDDIIKNYIGKPASDLLSQMDGSFDTIGKGKLKAFINKAKGKLKTVLKAAEKVGFAPARGAFLGLIKLGEALEKTPLKIHLADKLALQWAKDPTALKKFWSDFGGKPDELGKVIMQGHKTTIGMIEEHIGLKAHEFQAFDRIEDVWESPFRHKPAMKGDYIGQAAAVAGAITAAMPIIIKVKEILVKSGLIDAKTANSIDGVMDSVLKNITIKVYPM